MASILHAHEGKTIDLQPLFMSYTLDSIGELGFGIQIDALGKSKEAIEFAESFDYVNGATARRYAQHPFWKWIPDKTFHHHRQKVDAFVTKIVEDRRKDIAEGIDFSNNTDLLSKFMLARGADGNPMFDNKYLLDVLKNFVIAGRDTTAICLTWTFYLLATHPEVEQKLLDEIEKIIGDNITYEKLHKLKYTRQVIDESLRLYPPVPLDVRINTKPDVLPSGHSIPAGTKVIYPGWIIHRLSQYWNDPLAFQPERWETDTFKPFQFVAFHGGPRVCLGQNLAYEEIKVALCFLLPLFQFRVVAPESVEYSTTLTLPARYGVRVNVSLRKNPNEGNK